MNPQYAELMALTPEMAHAYTDSKLWDCYHKLHLGENDFGHDATVARLAIVLNELKKRGLLNEYPWSASVPIIPNVLDEESAKLIESHFKEYMEMKEGGSGSGNFGHVHPNHFLSPNQSLGYSLSSPIMHHPIPSP
jgi:hypothetical protein